MFNNISCNIVKVIGFKHALYAICMQLYNIISNRLDGIFFLVMKNQVQIHFKKKRNIPYSHTIDISIFGCFIESMPVGCSCTNCTSHVMCLCDAHYTPETIDVLTMEKDVQCDDCLFRIVNII